MSTQPIPAPPEKTLYVICHGALALLQTSTNLIIMIPDLGSTHTYRAGTWLAETSIEKGSMYMLENVTGGQGSLVNANISAAPPAPPALPPFATFLLPLPQAVYSPFKITIPNSLFTATPINSSPDGSLTVEYVTVLEYTYTVLPSLGGIWPVAGDNSTILTDNPLTLHIYAEDEIELDDAHSVSAFNLTAQMLGLKYRLPDPLPLRGFQAKAVKPLGPVPPGLENRCFEFQPLDSRRDSLLQIATAKQTGNSIPDPWSSMTINSLERLAIAFFGGAFSPLSLDNSNGSCLNLSGALAVGTPPPAAP
jgi:hypothetical protein